MKFNGNRSANSSRSSNSGSSSGRRKQRRSPLDSILSGWSQRNEHGLNAGDDALLSSILMTAGGNNTMMAATTNMLGKDVVPPEAPLSTTTASLTASDIDADSSSMMMICDNSSSATGVADVAMICSQSQAGIDKQQWQQRQGQAKQQGKQKQKQKQKQKLFINTPYARSRLMPFPKRLHQMLCDVHEQGKQDIVSWLPDGNLFAIHKPKEFVDEIVPIYFNMSKFRSFTKQLLNYGFERVGTYSSFVFSCLIFASILILFTHTNASHNLYLPLFT